MKNDKEEEHNDGEDEAGSHESVSPNAPEPKWLTRTRTRRLP